MIITLALCDWLNSEIAKKLSKHSIERALWVSALLGTLAVAVKLVAASNGIPKTIGTVLIFCWIWKLWHWLFKGLKRHG